MPNIKKKARFGASCMIHRPPSSIFLFHFRFLFLLLFLSAAVSSAFAQTLKSGSYGVAYVADTATFNALCRNDADKQLLELHSLMPSIVYDLRYAGNNNFTGIRLYKEGTHTTYLRKPAAKALAKVQHALKRKNLGLKVFDAYRPYDVTVAFWELIKDERYVANPSKGSGHNRGLAIDLTIIDLSTGKDLDMGTGFDDFSDTAHHTFTSLPTQILANRQLLKEMMIKAGFLPFETEWWHYAWPNDKNYEVLNLSFEEVESCCKIQKTKRRNRE